jgi:hypothetical protein
MWNRRKVMQVQTHVEGKKRINRWCIQLMWRRIRRRRRRRTMWWSRGCGWLC